MDERRAVLARLLRRLDAARRPAQDIAIIGVAGRYPLAADPDELWANLRAGRHCVRAVPPERWPLARHFDPDATDGSVSYSKWAGFIDDVDKFDPLFFQISPSDADAMDPQERLFLETAWATVEDAGYAPRQLGREQRVGVFVGVMNNNYEWMGGEADALGVRTEAHSSHWAIANRVSYVLNFQGPSLAVDTACSSSLTAIHLACDSLRRGECAVAVAGGVNLILHPMHLRMLSARGMISHDDRCKSFGAGADGFVDGEGVGAVLLKPLATAESDGDRILAVISGSAINSAGKTGGFTVPSATAQADVIVAALRAAGVDPRTVGYVEAHGTGTALGDPIEIAGLREAFRQLMGEESDTGPAVLVGSVKSNIGHLESAAGIAGLTKVLLQLRHGIVVPSLHSAETNPKIDFAGTPFAVPQRALAWPRPTTRGPDGQPVELPRTAGISSFGGGGANAHLVVREYLPRPAAVRTAAAPELIVLSARNPERLRAHAARMARFLAAASEAAPPAADAVAECTRLCADILGVPADALDPHADLLEYGFGAPERAALATRLPASAPPAVVASATIADLATALGGRAGNGPALADIANTLQVGREEEDARLALVAGDVAEAAELLRQFAEGEQPAGVMTAASDGRPARLTPPARDRLERALASRDLATVGRLWTAGAVVDWARCHQGARPGRVSLPTYPFARKRYWIPTPPPRPVPETVLASPAPADDRPALGYYRPVWAPAGAVPDQTTAGTVLVLATEDTAELAAGIAAGSGGSVLRLDQPEAAPAALAADRIYYVDALGTPGDRADEDRLTRLFGLAKRLGASGRASQLTIVTSDAQPVLARPVADPVGAALHGFAQVLPKEHPQLRVCCVDLASADLGTAEGLANAVAAVLAEVPDSTGATVAIRDGRRYQRRLAEVRLPVPEQVPFREQGVYLLVGGTGGIGMALSVELAARYAARLVWVSRGELGAEQRDCVHQVRAHGGDVLHVRADASQPDQLRRAVAEARDRFGGLHGAVHTAMRFDNRAIAELDETEFAEIIGIKVGGTVALARALAGESLDFLAVFSSIGAFAGTAGNAAYTCATGFQDAYAWYLSTRVPYPVRVINWGYWGQVGSGARAGLAELFGSLGIAELDRTEGLAAVWSVLGNPLCQVMPVRATTNALARMGLAEELTGQLFPPRAASLRTALPGLGGRTEDAGVAGVLHGYARLGALCDSVLLDVYRRMGVFTRAGERYGVAELAGRLGIVPKFRRLHVALLNILAEAGLLAVDGDLVSALSTVEQPEQVLAPDRFAAEFDAIASANPDIEPTVTLCRLFLASYPEILRGELAATEIMFPGSSMALVQNFYKGNPLTDSFNLLVRDAVAGYARQHPDQPVRVVELGAGTGATTERVLPVLAEHPGGASYCFTDISPRFLEFGQERFAAWPFVDFRVLNLERGIEEQGFTTAGADLVVATNVVHATRGLRATIRKAKALLRPGGWLVLNELTTVRGIITIGGGVLDGWWLFDDPDLRQPDSPLATPATWARLLREEGFAEIAVLGAESGPAGEPGQRVLVGESDGVVLDGVVPDAVPSATPAPEPAADQAGELLGQLREVVERALKLDEPIDPDRQLADYGFDSLTGTRILAEIAEVFGVKVPLSVFFDHPTLRAVTTHLVSAGLLRPLGAPTVAGTAPEVAATVPATSYPLSEGQRALWIVDRIAPGTAAYHVPLALWLDPGVDADALAAALQDLVDRHEVLRSTVEVAGRQPVQRVAARVPVSIGYEPLDTTAEERLRERLRAAHQQPFDLARGPLLRATLYGLPDGRRALSLTVHHIVLDGVSIAVLLRELDAAYQARVRGHAWTPAPPAARFADFVAWQRDLLAGPDGARLRDYWLNRIEGQPPRLDLPVDRERREAARFVGASVAGTLDAALVERARALAAEQRVSLFSVLLAGYHATLHGYRGQDRILVGTPTSGRSASRFDEVLGCFMNMVVIDQRVRPDQPFRSLVTEVHRTTLDALEHGDYPLITLVEQLRAAGRLTGASLFDAAFYYQNWVRSAGADAGLVRGNVGGVYQEGEFDLTLQIIEGTGDFHYTVKYDPDLFDQGTAVGIGTDYVRTLTRLLGDPDQPLAGPTPRPTASRTVATSLAGITVRRTAPTRPAPDAALLRQLETALARVPGVARAVVLVRPGADGPVLRGYYQPDPAVAAEPPLADLLREWLPPHLALDAVLRLAELPSTADGEVDRAALTNLAEPVESARPVEPVRPAEPVRVVPAVAASTGPVADALAGELAGLLAEAADLPVAQVAEDQPFGRFGLDSIRFTELSLRLTELAGAEVLPTVFYRFPTLADLTAHLVAEHGPALAARYGLDLVTEPVAPVAPSIGAEPVGTAGDVAIVGMAAKLPRSADLDAFWAHLLAGDDLIEDIPADRWDWRDYHGDPLAGEKSRSRWGGFVPDVDRFDAAFFGVSPREAELMDPQQRLLLETVWTALEDAGIRPSTLAGRRVGVFIGVTNSDYLDVQRAAGRAAEGHTITGAALSIIPNRISYLLDLRGPSVAVDTACSGSLTAVHQAVRALRAGECDLAIAGGVSLILSPSLYVALSKGEMLSPDGRCKTFDARANGYVRGEGVGVVVLRDLAAATEAADPVYAVIRATALNHDGRTTSLTSPNPAAQTALLVDAYQSAGIDPATIDYLEAHGTGTALGDPIEIAGLKDAFTELYRAAGRPLPAEPGCWVGSVKTNIGHLEAAAGIAGLLKVVLAIRHHTIPASLHFETENPYLELAGSPLRVVAETTPWPTPVDGQGRPAPRRGGVSSFGFGGANAHVVLEEWPAANNSAPAGTQPQLFVLSARTEEALRESADRLGRYLRSAPVRLADVAYTLQVGREAMTERLAVLASDQAELLAQLDAYLAGGDEQGRWRGRVRRPTRTARTGTSARQDLAKALAADHDLAGIAELWVAGSVEIDWAALYGTVLPHRISLPGYPFARTRYWPEPTTVPATLPGLHPTLLDANVSTFREHVFAKRLTGAEFFLRDHVVAGAPMLPAVAYLELARLAGELADADRPVRALRDVLWGWPVVLGEVPTDLRIRLSPNGELASFEIDTEDDGIRRPHASGTVVFGPAGPAPAAVDLVAVRARCDQHRSRAECYQLFTELGFAYGPSFQTIDELVHGDREALATVTLPAALRASAADYRLHPALFDAALQAVGWLVSGPARTSVPYLPFAIGAVELFGALTEQCLVHVRVVDQDDRPEHKVFDIQLCAETGAVLARLTAFTLRAVPDGQRLGAAERVAGFRPDWHPVPAGPAELPGTVLVLGDPAASAALADALRQRSPRTNVLVARPDEVDPAALLASGGTGIVQLAEDTDDPGAAHRVFHLVRQWCQRWLAGRLGAARYLYVFNENSTTAPAHAALAGFARSARVEYPALALSTVAHAETGSPTEAVALAFAAPAEEVELRVAAGVVHGRRWQPVPLPATPEPLLGGAGVHVISGGTGALGLLLAERLASQPDAVVALLGRSAPSAAAQERIDRLVAAGRQVVALRVDVTRRDEVRAAIRQLADRHGRIAGVLHLAGALRDALLVHKTEDEADAVLGPKVLGAHWLDEATSELPLDYFVAFSSAAAVFGNAGQTDYAFANAYLDHFVARRERLRARGLRHGRGLSVNWPVWRDGAMRVTADAHRWMARELGMSALAANAGLAGLDQALATGLPQLLVATGDPDRMLAALPGSPTRTPAPVTVPAAPRPAGSVHEAALALVVELLGAAVKLPVAEIDPDQSFDEYGVDSLLVMSLTRELEARLGPVSRSLFFEYFTPTELADHLAASHPDALGASPATVALPTASPVRTVPVAAPDDDEIAIIGVAGRYPQADDLWEFWSNLRDGRDCVEEIPRERWDHDRFYSPDRNAPGKTYGRWGGFVRDADRFDPLFFRMSQAEAEHIDPQERVFLETVWHLLEDAGYPRSALAGTRTGVFVGMMYGHYQLYGVTDALRGKGFPPSSSYASVANRVSYFFDFTGPSVALDTMCSSSLVTIHQACQAIRAGDCEVAVAGGVNISSHPVKYLQLAQRGFLSTDGRCRSFGDGGDGYVPGEGSGAVLLKRLSSARADGDRILAVVGATTVNHGGAGKGYSVPNPRAHGELISLALRRAGLRPGDVNYIEAHGTGTGLGDPVEITGLTRAYGAQAPGDRRWPIGSVKSNIGHLESAAGVAAVTKVLLQLRHQTLVPSLHSEPPNDNIDFGTVPFAVQRTVADWSPTGPDGQPVPRIAAISSFGAGGTNAHVILREYPTQPAPSVPGPYLFVLSARDADRLAAYALRLAAFLRGPGADVTPAALAYTLQVGREPMAERLAIEFRDLPDLLDRLDRFGSAVDVVLPGCYRGKASGRPAGAPGEPVDLAGIARAWVAGAVIDWPARYADAVPGRIALPGYPFARELCWLDVARAEVGGADTGRPSVLLTQDWVAAPDPAPTRPRRAVAILSTPSTTEVAHQLAGRLGNAVVLTEDELRDPNGRPDFDGVVDLAGLALAGEDRDLAGWQPWLARLVEHGPRDQVALLVTSGLAGAVRAGLYRMLQSEYAHVRSRQVDLPAGLPVAELAEVIAAELAADDEQSLVRYRDGVRHRPDLRSTPVTGPAPRLDFPADQVLLVTGGTRGLGLRCAEHFVRQHGVRKLVLTGREQLPPREQWAAHDPDTPLGQKLAALTRLAATGVDLRVLALPLDDRAAVAAALGQLRQELGPIGGLLHCAGSTDFDSPAFVRKPVDRFRAVLAPKVDGVDAVLASLAGEPLRFAVLFSSVAAAVPALAVGQSDYAMANAYLDHVAEARPYGLPVVSVRWPSWRDSGMGEVRTAAYRRSGLASLSDVEGLDLLDRVLDGSAGPVVLPAVLSGEPGWDANRLLGRRFASDPIVDPAPVAPPTTGDTVSEEVRAAATDWLLDLLATELRFDRAKLAEDVPVQDFGPDSITLAQLVQAVAKRLAVRLDPSALIEYPTVAGFVGWLAVEHGPALVAAFDTGTADARPIEAAHHRSVVTASVPEPVPAAGWPADIAVIGMSCRFPGAPDLDAYWRLLAEGRSAIAPVPPARLDGAPQVHAGLLAGHREFDPEFFLLDEADVAAMDPQALLLLEQTLLAVHHAGYAVEEVRGGRIGVYVGGRTHHLPEAETLRRSRNPIVATGQNYLAANVSHFFDLRGPSVVVDTACSSALVAMDLALPALRSGEVDAAVVAGVSLLTDDTALRVLGQRGVLSAAPAFHVFDQRAAGLVLGEGVGVVVLKPLARALADGDRVHAVIRGLAVNNDGRTAGPATPNPLAQQEVLRTALARSGRRAEDVAHIEVNGSGSPVTDLIELKAIRAAYPAASVAGRTLGSIKPNIGHPLCAEGIASFIKVVLMLDNGRIVPFLSGQQPMEHFDLANSRLRLPRAESAWPDGPLVAGVNCFADGGTNVHVIVEGWRETDPARPIRPALPAPRLNRRPVGPAATETPVLRERITFPATHPLLAGHRANGSRLLPGLAYLDLVYRLFVGAGHRIAELELTDLVIRRPLVVAEDGVVEVDLTARPTGPNRWQVSAADLAGEPFVTVTVAAGVAAPLAGALDVATRPATGQPMAEIYHQHRLRGLVHSGVLRAEGTVFADADGLTALVELGPEARATAGEYLVHPTLLDASAIAAAPLFAGLASTPDELFLPIHVAAFRASGPVREACYARVERASVGRRNELVRLSVELFDQHGRQVAQLRELSSKAVGPAGLAAPQPPAARPTVRPAGTGRAEAMLRAMVAERLGRSADEVDAGAGYYQLGLQSVEVLDLVAAIETRVGLPVPPTVAFEHPTVRDLAAHLEREYPDAFHAAPASPVPVAAPVARPAEARPVDTPAGTAIAIVGLAGRYPGAGSVRDLWTNLCQGRDSVTEVPATRWSAEAVAGIHGPTGRPVSRWGGFVDEPDRFDAEFFRVSPREAQSMDPQERLFLQTCWAAIEDAGYTPAGLAGDRGRVGVFAGVMHNDYLLVGADAAARTGPVPVALNQGQIANRVSFACDFHGPSVTVDTLCSSSLTAIHLAVRSLCAGESAVAVAGGVNLSLHPAKYVTYGLANMHSSDGACRAFGADGDGYVSAEGVGAVVLKPLADAVRAGDHVYAVIRASAVGHGGASSGITVPSPTAQADVVGACLAEAGVDARTVGYVEAHGTGTALGDPIEISGLTAAFRQHTEDTGFCAIGSVKSNIGHTEAAAGIAALTKVALQLRHGRLVPSLHSQPANPQLRLAQTPFRVSTELRDWPVLADDSGRPLPRRAGVSSFGATGSTAHLLVEEYLPATVGRPGSPGVAQVVPVSARDTDRLHEYLRRLVAFLRPAEPADTTTAVVIGLLAGVLGVAERDISADQQWSEYGVDLAGLAALADRLRDDADLQVSPDELLGAGSVAGTSALLADQRTDLADGIDLADLAFTLQVGRVPLAERIAFVVSDVRELVAAAEAVLAGRPPAVPVYQGRVGAHRELVNLFAGDAGYHELVRGWATEGATDKLAATWVRGFDLDWTRCHPEGTRRRLSLPSYPFGGQRYWIGEDRPSAITPPAAEPPVLLLRKDWQPAELPVAAQRQPRGQVIVLANVDTAPLAAALTERLAGYRVTVVDQDGPAGPVEPDCVGWIDLRGCGTQRSDDLAWLPGLQRLVEAARDRDVVVLGVTRDLEPFGGAAVNLAGAAHAALYRGLGSEYGYLRSRHVDTDLPLGDTAGLAGQVAAEFAAGDAEPAVCYRAGVRYRPVLRPAEAAAVGRQPGFGPAEVMWITGGTRGIGALCARHLVRTNGVRRLVLHGRTGLPPRAQWPAVDPTSDLGRRIALVGALEAAGAEVRVLDVPLTDGVALAGAVREVTEQWGPIGGLLHAAGLGDPDNPAFVRKSVAGVRTVLAPKVAGLDALWTALRGQPLRYAVLFSSVSAVVPSLAAGQLDYAMANSYLDSFAAARTGAVPVVSVQWPSWRQTGMGEVTSRAYRDTGLLAHSDETGLAMLDRVLAGVGAAVVLPATVDPARWQPERVLGRRRASTPTPVPPAVLVNPDRGELAARIRAWLVTLFSAELAAPPARFDGDLPFPEYGIDSILLAQVLQPINATLAEKIDPSALYEHPTFDSLAGFLARTHGDTLATALAAETPAPPVSAPPAPAPVSVPVAPAPVAAGAPVAVVGLACRFPGADSPADYWRLLTEGRSAIGVVPTRRWAHDGSHHAALLSEAGEFDHELFRIPAEDAAAMDPQALLVLQQSLALFERAGYRPDEIKGRPIGVYLGGRAQHRPAGPTASQARHPIRAVGQNYLATNVTQFLDLRGPAMVVDTACSSGLVALNIAVQALRAGEIEAAVVGAVSLLASGEVHTGFQQRGILSATPEFHVFDGRANGIVPGEGCGLVLLKLADQAQRDGDRIQAVLTSVAVNNNGRTAGPAAPSFQAQQELLRTALARSGRRPDEIGYLETNGSGAEVTDVLELKTIESVYRAGSTQPLVLGSIKPNIGHPMTAEGIASFIKVVLMLQHRQRVPLRSAGEPMAHYDLAASPFVVDREPVSWPGEHLVAGVNCFADGGTNVHLIVESWEGAGPATPPAEPVTAPPVAPTESANHHRQPVLVGSPTVWEEYR